MADATGACGLGLDVIGFCFSSALHVHLERPLKVCDYHD